MEVADEMLEEQASVMVDSSNKDRQQIQSLREAEQKKLSVKLEEKLLQKKEFAKERLYVGDSK